MEYINYDFQELQQLMFNLKSDQSSDTLRLIKEEVNKFFNDSICKDIIFTLNTDKPFFGIIVMPNVNSENCVGILMDDSKFRVNDYIVEIDSRILNIGLSAKELTAVLIYEIGSMVNDSQPAEDLRNAVNVYLQEFEMHLIITKSIQYRDILCYGIKDSLRKLTSLFCLTDDTIIADEFIVRCGLGPELERAYKDIRRYIGSLNQISAGKFIVLQWVLRLYNDVLSNRIRALHTLERAKFFTASVLEIREINNVLRRLNQIDDDSIISEGANMFDAIGKKLSQMRSNMKYKGIRQLEDDLYEYNLRIKNVDEEQEALSILRDINTRMSIIDDYIMSEDLSDSQKKRWFDLMDKYRKLRDDLSKKTTYDDKYYGLFVKTPVVKSRYEV